MKIKFLTFLMTLFCVNFALAQDPILDCAASGNGDGTVCAAAVADFSVSLSDICGLANTEYVISDPNTTLDPDGTPGNGDEGFAVLGASDMAAFDPTTFGVGAVGSEFCVTAVCYDVSQLQDLIDAIYGNSDIPFLSCCALVESQFMNLCTDLMAAGINSGADIANLQDVITVAGVFSGGVVTLESVVGVIGTLNANLGTLGSVGCDGGVTNIDYMIDGVDETDNTGTPASCCYTVIADTEAACMTVACAIDPIDAPAAPVVTSESTCAANGMDLEGGVIDYAGTTCPEMSTLEYSTDGGTNWVTVAPAYDQTTAITVTVRCLCNEDMMTASPTAEVTTMPGTCPQDMCTVVAGEPATPATDVCPAGQGPGPNGEMELTPTMDDLMTLSGTPAPTGTNANGAAPTVNYVITDAAGVVLDVVGNVESMTYDFSPFYGAVGSSFCVYQAAYTQETIDDIAIALNDVLCSTLCAGVAGCVGDLLAGGCPVLATPTELAGVLDVLNSVFALAGQPLTASDVDDFLNNQVITIPTGSVGIPGISDFDFNLADFGLEICGDLSNMGACFNVVTCTVDCDAACANDVFIQIESIEIVDPGQVVGTLNPLDNPIGCAGAATLDGVDGFIELDIIINGNAIAQISVDGGTAGVTAGPFGAAVAAGTTACGDANVTASVSVSDDDTAVTGGADDLTTNPTEVFTLGGGTFSACDGNIIITYSTTCTVDCAVCADCPVITAVDMPVDGCDATMQTVCVTYDQDPTGLVTTDINGVVGTIDPVAFTICYDIPLANTTCDPTMLDFVHTATCVDGGANILDVDGVDTNGSIGMINVYPIYDVVVVQPACDGAAGSAEVQVNGVACATPTAVAGTAGVTNVCPTPAPGTPATLVYDFSADANIVAATAAGCAPTGAALMDDISTACDKNCNAVCEITDITAGAPVCAADGLTYTVTVTVTGTDASVTLDDGTGAIAATTTIFTFNSGAGYTITVADTDGVCAFGPFMGADPACPVNNDCAISAAIITSATSCDTGDNDDNADDMVTYTVAITDNGNGTAAPGGWSDDMGNTGTYGSSINYTVIAGSGPLVIIYTDDTDSGCMSMVTIDPPLDFCETIENIPTVGQWGLIILGLLMSITAVVGIRQRREDEVYS